MSRGPFGGFIRAVVEAGKLTGRYWWVAPLLLGFLPALLLSNVLLGSISAASGSCARIEFGAPGSRYGGCSIIAGELIVAVAIAWIVPLLVLAALFYLSRRARRGTDGRGDPSGAAEGYADRLDRTALFVRVVAVLVGLANMLAIGDPADVVGSAGVRSPAFARGNALTAVLAGLLAAEILLRKGRPLLEGGFFARYGIAALGLCLGGAILGGTSWVLGGFFSLGPVVAEGPEGGIPFAAYALLSSGMFAAVVGAVLGLLEGVILGLPLAAVLGRLERTPRGRNTPLPTAILMGTVTVAALVSYAAAPPPNPATASTADIPPLSCPEYLGREVASVEGPGDETTPAFDTKGSAWGYQHASAGPGSLSVRVLDGEGREVMPPEDSLDASEGNSVGSAEFTSTGTFALNVRADDDLKYKVLVCDEAYPGVRGQGDSAGRGQRRSGSPAARGARGGRFDRKSALRSWAGAIYREATDAPMDFRSDRPHDDRAPVSRRRGDHGPRRRLQAGPPRRRLCVARRFRRPPRARVSRSRMAESARTALNPYRFAGTGGEVTIPPDSGINAVSRSYILRSYYFMFGIFVALALSGSMLRLLLRGRARPET